jgi:hypothetical protein
MQGTQSQGVAALGYAMGSVISTIGSPSRNETSACANTVSSTVLMWALEVLPMVIQITLGGGPSMSSKFRKSRSLGNRDRKPGQETGTDLFSGPMDPGSPLRCGRDDGGGGRSGQDSGFRSTLAFLFPRIIRSAAATRDVTSHLIRGPRSAGGW